MHVFRHDAMATHFVVQIPSGDALWAENVAQHGFKLIDELEHKWSRFIPQSDIYRLNLLKEDQQLILDYETWQLLLDAFSIHQLTHGAFDVGVARLMDVFRAHKQGLVDDYSFQQQLQNVLKEKQQAQLFIDPEEPIAYCLKPGFVFDLGAIGKGRALDLVADLFVEFGCSSFVLNAGDSSILSRSEDEETPFWEFELATPRQRKTVRIHSESIAASGTGRQGQHIFDPRIASNENVSEYRRLWVCAQSATEADAWSTALFITPPHELERIVNEVESVTWVAYSSENELHIIGSADFVNQKST